MKFFNAVKNGSTIGKGTVGELVRWIEAYVNVLFPDNGIDYWSDHKFGGGSSLKHEDPVPAVGGDDGVHHVACYVRGGHCEGQIIEVGLFLRNGQFKYLTWAKTFGKDDECWMIARAISAALDSLLLWNEIPEVVEMSDKVPRQYRWYRESNLHEEVTIAASYSGLVVSTPSGLILDNRDWSEHGVNAKFYVESRVQDWKTVLTNTKVRFREVAEKRAVFAELPGYLFTNRGVEGVEGVYVLPPGGRLMFDCDWLGYFPNLDSAVKAAEAHQAAQRLKCAA